MNTFSFKKTFTAMVLMLLTVASGFATDGYFSTGYGTINKGLAGAGIAYYQGSLINGNPAGLAFLGKKYQFGVNLFNPNREFTVSGNPSGEPGTFGLMPGTVESASKYFVIPSMGANWMINETSSFSAALFANGGMNTHYPPGGFGDINAEFTGVNLGQMFANLSYSIMLSENHSLGVTGVLSYQYFEADGLIAFTGFSASPENVSGNGASNSFGYGFKVGYMGKLADNFSIGATYQSRVYMSEFDEYAGLFAEKGDFDIPSSWTAGFSWDVTEDFTLMGDVKQINYGEVKSIANVMIGAQGFNAPLGASTGAGFGWEDVMVYKVGLSYSGIDSWTFRGGFSTGSNPIKESEVFFNILAPGVIENQVSLGFSKDLEKSKGRNKKGDSVKQLHVAFNYALDNKVMGANMMDYTSGQTIEIGMNQLELEIGFSF